MRRATLIAVPVLAVFLALSWIFVTTKRDVAPRRDGTDISSLSLYKPENSGEPAGEATRGGSPDIRPSDSALYDKTEKSAQEEAIDDQIGNLLEWAKVLGSAVHCGVIDDVSASALLGNRERTLQDEFGPSAWVEKFVRNDEKPGVSPDGQVITNYRNAVATTRDCSSWRSNQQLVYQLRKEASEALTPP